MMMSTLRKMAIINEENNEENKYDEADDSSDESDPNIHEDND